MNMTNLKVLLMMLSASLVAMSCSETDEPGEYDNWQGRNIAYIDSIANVARANADGSWNIFLGEGLSADGTWGNEYYVYCKELQKGDGTQHPMANDTILVNYRGRLIPTKTYPDGYIFDQSYIGELDPAVDVPVKLNLITCVRGWRTAVANMVKGTTPESGDIWRIYVPATLGYGTSASGAIPAYSTLIFDINLVDFYNIGTPVPEN